MCTSAPIAVANAVVSSPMVPGPQTSIRFPGPAWAAEAARQPLPPGEQLDVGPADPGPADIDDDLARSGYRRLDILDPGRSGPRNHECAHIPKGPITAGRAAPGPASAS